MARAYIEFFDDVDIDPEFESLDEWQELDFLEETVDFFDIEPDCDIDLEKIESVCVVDYCGNYNHPGFWGDYYPDLNLTRFGGSWWLLPPMVCNDVPSEDEVYEYAYE